MVAAIVVFAVAALGGLFLAVQRLKDRAPPMPVALVHGAVAAVGLVLLILAVVGGAGGTLGKTALAIFVVAALGGFVLFSFHLRKQKLPVPLMVVHALAAVAAFVLLILATVGA